MENEYKLVEFERFCVDCKWVKEHVDGEHCSPCIAVAARKNSHRPEKFEMREKRVKFE